MTDFNFNTNTVFVIKGIAVIVWENNFKPAIGRFGNFRKTTVFITIHRVDANWFRKIQAQ